MQSLRLLVRLPTVVVTVAMLFRVVAEHRRPMPLDDCRPVARLFNDTFKTRPDQIVHDRKKFGESN